MKWAEVMAVQKEDRNSFLHEIAKVVKSGLFGLSQGPHILNRILAPKQRAEKRQSKEVTGCVQTRSTASDVARILTFDMKDITGLIDTRVKVMKDAKDSVKAVPVT